MDLAAAAMSTSSTNALVNTRPTSPLITAAPRRFSWLSFLWFVYFHCADLPLILAIHQGGAASIPLSSYCYALMGWLGLYLTAEGVKYVWSIQ